MSTLLFLRMTPPSHLTLENVGQIKKADIGFGDLTVLVGPQATGKSVSLQLLKLIVDAALRLKQLCDDGVSWDNFNQLLNVYFGEGMHSLWRADSRSLGRSG